MDENSFDGIILSNVLDVMPKEELESFGYENMGNHIYEENHVMRLRQATTKYWKDRFARFGKEIVYLEFEYPWQEGMNRLFVYQS